MSRLCETCKIQKFLVRLCTKRVTRIIWNIIWKYVSSTFLKAWRTRSIINIFEEQFVNLVNIHMYLGWILTRIPRSNRQNEGISKIRGKKDRINFEFPTLFYFWSFFTLFSICPEQIPCFQSIDNVYTINYWYINLINFEI